MTIEAMLDAFTAGAEWALRNAAIPSPDAFALQERVPEAFGHWFAESVAQGTRKPVATPAPNYMLQSSNAAIMHNEMLRFLHYGAGELTLGGNVLQVWIDDFPPDPLPPDDVKVNAQIDLDKLEGTAIVLKHREVVKVNGSKADMRKFKKMNQHFLQTPMPPRKGKKGKRK